MAPPHGAERGIPALLRWHHLGDLLEALDSGCCGAAPVAAKHTRRVLNALRERRTTCLYRALTGFASLRRGGDKVKLVIGVRVDGGELVAHAWLERDGEPLGERADPRSRYAVAFAYPAGRGAAGPDKGHSHMADDKVSGDIILTELQDGSGVLLDLRTKFYFTLNRTGVAVWKLLAAGERGGAEALAPRIEREFEGAVLADVRRDVEALLKELEAEGLLSVAEGAR